MKARDEYILMVLFVLLLKRDSGERIHNTHQTTEWVLLVVNQQQVEQEWELSDELHPSV